MARIIVIEDEPAIRRLVVRILARGEHEVREAANGREGVALHRADPADLVITDLFMPEQDGIETIRQIREFAPSTPILAMSGGGSRGNTDSLEDAELLGADVVLMKPFSPEDLEKAVAGALGGR
jgi:CheY-like chemotaxis protein